MNINLHGGTTGSFDANQASWAMALRLARMYGWYPARTTLDPAAGERVNAEDASAIGAALARALPNVPAQPAKNRESAADPRQWFSGRHGREWLGRLVLFCGAGFVIA